MSTDKSELNKIEQLQQSTFRNLTKIGSYDTL